MCKVQMLRSLLTQRLTAAAEEILGLFERTMEQYEEECSCSKEDRQRVVLDAICGSARSPKMSRVQMLRVLVNQRLTAAVEETFGLIEKNIGYEKETDRQRMLVEDSVKPEIQINKADSPQILLKVEQDPHPIHIKEEQEELWTTQEGEQFQGLEEADITKFPLTPVPVKSENNEEKPQYPQHSLTQTEGSREAEPLASTSTEEMKTEADGEDCGLSEPTSNLTLASDVQPTSDGQLSSDCSETQDSDDDWKETNDAQSCLYPPKNKESHTRAPLTCATTSSACQRSGNRSVDDSKRTSSRQRKATPYMETSLDESDHTDYSDPDYVPDSEAGSSSEPDAKQDIDSESPVKRNTAVSPKKSNLDTPRKRKISSPSPQKSNSNTPKKSRIQQVCDSIRVLPPSNSETRRVYNKRNYCLFCLKPTSKLARHLESVHGNVAEVALAFQYPKNSKERRNKLNILRNRGNFAHNTSVVREGAGQLQACYRPRESRRAIDFIHCFHCQGLYGKKTLRRHIKICPVKKETGDEFSIGKGRDYGSP